MERYHAPLRDLFTRARGRISSRLVASREKEPGFVRGTAIFNLRGATVTRYVCARIIQIPSDTEFGSAER